MTTGLEAADWPPPRTGGEHATREWLDALASGRCDPETFTRAMRDRFRTDRNGNWEVLSLLDQYFRRGKIKPEVFQSVKSRLEVSALGANENPAAVERAETPIIAPARPRAATAPAPGAAPTLTHASAAHASAAQAKSHSHRDLAAGDVLRRRYRLIAEVNHGGNGTVFAATDDYRLDLPSTDQRVAIKVLHSAEQQREFQHMQLLSHPNILRVHEFDRDGGIAFYTMELLNGAPLNQVLMARNGAALPRPYALAIIRYSGAALSYAHSRGVVHGDLSPQNIFITNDGEVRVMDFGAAHQLIEGRSPDVRDDVFAFACVAYVLLSGRHPFPQHTALEARMRRLRPPRPAGISGTQWRALREGLHWERARRPSDVGKWLSGFELQAASARLPALAEIARTPPPRNRHLVLKTAAFALFALLVAAGYWVLTEDNSPAHGGLGWDDRIKSALNGIGATIERLTPTRTRKPTIAEPEPNAADAPDQPQTATVPAPVPAPAPAPDRTALGTPATPPASSRTAPTPARAAAPPATPSQASRAEASHVAAAAGAVHIEMAADTVEIPASERTAHVIIQRKGNRRGDSRFTWWTESGTAKPGVDFVAIAPHEEEFADGSSSLSLNIPVPGTPHSQPKSFYVVIGPAESGATLTGRTLTMVTILPPEG